MGRVRLRLVTLMSVVAMGACTGRVQVQSLSAVGPGQVQPFVDRPSSPYTPPPPPAASPFPTASPPCRAAQLAASGGDMGAAAGTSTFGVTVTNVSAAACLIAGSPDLEGLGKAGRLVPVPNTTHALTQPGDRAPADLAPGASAGLRIAMSGDCFPYRSPTFTQLGLVLPHGEGTVRSRLTFVETCGSAEVGLLGLISPPVPDPSPLPGTPGSLAARTDVPGQVRAGTTLRYVVTITNPSSVAVDLAPCPGYAESVLPATAVTPTVRTYLLNCDHVPAIPAGASVRYAMELPIPPVGPAAREVPAKFSWRLCTPTGPEAGGVFTIVP